MDPGLAHSERYAGACCDSGRRNRVVGPPGRDRRFVATELCNRRIAAQRAGSGTGRGGIARHHGATAARDALRRRAARGPIGSIGPTTSPARIGLARPSGTASHQDRRDCSAAVDRHRAGDRRFSRARGRRRAVAEQRRPVDRLGAGDQREAGAGPHSGTFGFCRSAGKARRSRACRRTRSGCNLGAAGPCTCPISRLPTTGMSPT